jgi:carbon monoxide dehydrogenase subunit G
VQLEHSFSVPVGIDEAWPILIDIERIGPCMPGAAIDSVDGDEFTGTVKVKLGPINLTYKGKAAFIEKDAEARRAVIDARGRDARGNGTAAAKITATLHDDGGNSTSVKVITDLDITGKPAQFGRGVMVDVGNKLLGQFADSLAKTIRGGDASAVVTAPPVATAPASADVAAASSPPAAAEPATAEPASAATPSEPSATQPSESGPAESAPAESAPSESAVVTAAAEETGAPESVPSYSVPGGVPVDDAAQLGSVNGRAPAPASKPHHHVEPIDLLHHAGPAVAKRLGPVLLGLIVLLIVIRRRHARS